MAIPSNFKHDGVYMTALAMKRSLSTQSENWVRPKPQLITDWVHPSEEMLEAFLAWVHTLPEFKAYWDTEHRVVGGHQVVQLLQDLLYDVFPDTTKKEQLTAIARFYRDPSVINTIDHSLQLKVGPFVPYVENGG